MRTNLNTVLQRYHYDANDKLISSTPDNEPSIQRFYREDRLATQLQGPSRYSIFQYEDQPLAQRSDQLNSLIATDLQGSVLQRVAASGAQTRAYSPYGFHLAESGLSSLLGFNGEPRDAITGCYHLGNGYRSFNPVLMRFVSPDSWSPFGDGGINAYAYCVNDPVNQQDREGHAPLSSIFKFVRRIFSSNSASKATHTARKKTTLNPIKTPLSAEPPGPQTPHKLANQSLAKKPNPKIKSNIKKLNKIEKEINTVKNNESQIRDGYRTTYRNAHPTAAPNEVKHYAINKHQNRLDVLEQQQEHYTAKIESLKSKELTSQANKIRTNQ